MRERWGRKIFSTYGSADVCQHILYSIINNIEQHKESRACTYHDEKREKKKNSSREREAAVDKLNRAKGKFVKIKSYECLMTSGMLYCCV